MRTVTLSIPNGRLPHPNGASNLGKGRRLLPPRLSRGVASPEAVARGRGAQRVCAPPPVGRHSEGRPGAGGDGADLVDKIHQLLLLLRPKLGRPRGNPRSRCCRCGRRCSGGGALLACGCRGCCRPPACSFAGAGASAARTLWQRRGATQRHRLRGPTRACGACRGGPRGERGKCALSLPPEPLLLGLPLQIAQ
jgi:hypothetical protein